MERRVISKGVRTWSYAACGESCGGGDGAGAVDCAAAAMLSERNKRAANLNMDAVYFD
jgi:hypothetical protein